MKNSYTVCVAMGGKRGCECCMGYRKMKPCCQQVPDYIPDSQIKKFLEARGINV